jgi:hypothetical protein
MRLCPRKYSNSLRGPGRCIDFLLQSHIFTQPGREEDRVSVHLINIFKISADVLLLDTNHQQHPT